MRTVAVVSSLKRGLSRLLSKNVSRQLLTPLRFRKGTYYCCQFIDTVEYEVTLATGSECCHFNLTEKKIYGLSHTKPTDASNMAKSLFSNYEEKPKTVECLCRNRLKQKAGRRHGLWAMS